jgi:hypothetical protein
MRRVQCKTCGIVVEAMPWASGKHHLTTAYLQFLAPWARRLSWQETADAFRTSWAQVCHAVEVRGDLRAGASHPGTDERHRRG